MAKTNFTKVEDALNEGLLQLGVKNLLEATDTKTRLSPEQRAQYGQLLAALHADLKFLSKHNKKPYETLSIDKDQVLKFFSNPAALMPHEWELVQKWKKDVDAYKAKVKKEITPESDEEIIKKQQKKHATKRFNINEKWLPLK